VTVDTRALVDKVLARYSGEFAVFRELLQNSDDAGCDTAEIHFETAAFLGLDPEAAMNAGPPIWSDLKTTNVAQWTFKNHGKPFSLQDWGRLPKIALGNPDPRKVGAFGVGFYSLFSVTESPYVSSGGKEMEFSWNDENQLYYRFGDLPQTAPRDLWTTFRMPLRGAASMPPVSELMQFLASSITFMVHLKDVTVFFDHHHVGKISKSLGQSQPIPIPTELKRLTPEKNMIVKSVQQHGKSFCVSVMPITLKARITLLQYDSLRMHETKVDLTAFTAEVDVTLDEKLSKELNRCMKKDPPSCLQYSLIYTEKDEYDQSCINEQKHLCEFPSVFRGLRADLDGATHTRIFIGNATAQTTGIGGHMASHFIPTVERESIDLVALTYPHHAVWNRELLYIGGFLCRAVYELELSKIQTSWEEAAAGRPCLRPSLELLDQSFLHLLKFFTFHHSTPSSKVAQLLADSFYGCSTLPLRLLSSVGVRASPDVRAFDPVFAKFLKSLPMLSEDVTRDCARFIAALQDQHKIPAITLSDVSQDLRRHTLDVEELVACLRWWITLSGAGLTSNMADLLDVITLSGTRGAIHLSSITSFIHPIVLGPHIPHDGPLPVFVIPPRISKHFRFEELAGFGWKEFIVTSWLRHISCPDVMSADMKYDFTRSFEWATRVLSTLCRIWPQLSTDMQIESRKVIRGKPCIPTCEGLRCPEYTYLPTADNALFHHCNPPIVTGFEVNERMESFLLFIGVRKDPMVRFLLNRLLSTGDWTVFQLVDYLAHKAPELASEDLSALKSSEIFTKESFQSNEEENTCHRAGELYPPVDIFRRLRLPVIEWRGVSEWRDSSPQAQLLYRLGLNRFPPLPKIVELCSSGDVGVQKAAFEHLCSELYSQYRDYKPEDFRDVEFIPAESKGRTCLRKLNDVYSGTQWKALGFSVVQDRYLWAPLHQLGVTQHPPTSKLLDLLEKTPPLDDETAVHWFEVLFDHMASFTPPDFIKLSGLPIIPTGPPSAPKLLHPTKCYLDQDTKPVLYAKLFVFVNFSTKANRFLSACGLKAEVSVEDVAKVLIKDPKRFFDLGGGYEGFVVELRKFAHQSQDISNNTLHQMSHKPALLGVRRQKREGQAVWDYEHKFLTYQGVTIVDDIIDYQLFSDCLFVAPQEEALERFYASLGCGYLSEIVQERCNDLHEIPATKTCLQVQSLILERLPLFIQNYTDTKPTITIPSSPDHLKVKACKRIRVSKTLVNGNVTRTRNAWAIARREGDCIELWISTTAKRDMYEIATSLCRLLFGTNKMNATVLLETIFSSDLAFLERRGFLVDQISGKQRDEYGVGNKATTKRSSVSAWITNSPQQSTQDTRIDPQLDRERVPGSSEATPQFPCLPQAADSILLKIRRLYWAFHIYPTLSVGSTAKCRHMSNHVSRTSREVIPQSYIWNNVEKAIEACRLGGETAAIHAGVSQFLSNGFCKVSADVGNLHPIGEFGVGRLRLSFTGELGQVKNIQVYVVKGMPDASTFIERAHGPLSRFVGIIITLADVYRIPTTTLRIFYDVSGGCIAFNCRGTIYLNLRYFEVWHDEQVRSGNRQKAQMSWFLALAHEIAHNLTDLHNSNHEFWFSAICENHLVAFSQLLRPINIWPFCVQWLGLMIIVILFPCLARCIVPVTNIHLNCS
ncbi:hypothetical protein F5J12DRAFT_962838, partial [Pisolithus orientalis]|uniref:uncharacterized protein n=1 Tax=Pisolithus orientalis TaxID=936130 RepID=UPI002224282C